MEKVKQEQSESKQELARNVEIVELDDASLEDIVGGMMGSGDRTSGILGDKNCGCGDPV